ncbi:hypothetical protein ACIQ8G_00445 [Streptomyces sp. NPDC094154]|uniref:hypothetical protein n=1 Tax=unclassified Streptomyces TaxID=2593676 RepID=UPI0038245EEC
MPPGTGADLPTDRTQPAETPPHSASPLVTGSSDAFLAITHRSGPGPRQNEPDGDTDRLYGIGAGYELFRCDIDGSGSSFIHMPSTWITHYDSFTAHK